MDGGGGRLRSRGGDTRGEWETWGKGGVDERWSDEREDDWLGDDAGSYGRAYEPRANETAGVPIDLTDDGLDEIGWPDLEPTGDAARDPRDDDDANWEEVGPGKVGVVTFGGNLGAGIAGGCSFMGDPEELEAERLGDAAEAATASVAADGDRELDARGFFPPVSDAFADDDDPFADDEDPFGEDWNR